MSMTSPGITKTQSHDLLDVMGLSDTEGDVVLYFLEVRKDIFMKITLKFDNVGSERDELIAEFLQSLIDQTLDFLNDLDTLEEEEE